MALSHRAYLGRTRVTDVQGSGSSTGSKVSWFTTAFMAALAHNVLKMVRRRLGRGVGLPGSVVPADVIAAKVGQAEDDAVADLGTLSRCFA